MKSIFIFFLLLTLSVAAQDKINFNASDGLSITADLYLVNPVDAPFIILFHQAGWSRGEYLEIAPKLNLLGYNCLAIDQRSGGQINEVTNETHKLAKDKNLGTNYVDALVDINSTIDYVNKTYTSTEKLIIWGSSYSSALSLKIAGDRNDIDAVLAFAPGEYFESLGKSSTYISESAKNIKVPVFITSAKAEKVNWWSIYKNISIENKWYFLPKTKGQHGSRALWEKFSEHKNYWNAVQNFLEDI